MARADAGEGISMDVETLPQAVRPRGRMTGAQRREAVFDPVFIEDLAFWTRTDPQESTANPQTG